MERSAQIRRPRSAAARPVGGSPGRRRARPLALLLVCAATLSSCADEPPPPVQIPPGFATDAAVVELLERKHAAVAADPSSAAGHRSLGLAFAANGGWELGEECFRNAIAVDAGDAESHLLLGLAAGERGDLPAKIERLQEAIELNPGLVAASYELACTFLDEGRLDDAERQFRSIRRGKSTPLAELGLGLVALERDDPEGALDHLVRFSEAYPGDAFTKFKVGEALNALGRNRQADVILADVEGSGGRPVLSSDAMMEMQEYRVGRADRLTAVEGLMDGGQYGAAVGILEALRESDPTDLPTLNSLSIAYLETGRLEEARAVLDELVARDPDQFGAHINLTSYWLRRAAAAEGEGSSARVRSHLGAALKSADRALALAPELGQAHNVRGRALAALDRHDEAVIAYRKAIENGRDDDEVHLNMLVSLEATGGPRAVIRALEEALAEDPNRFRLCYELTGRYLRAGDGAKARAQFRELEAISPNHPMVERADEALRRAGH